MTTPDQTELSALLEQSSLRHSHLCPRQVLGARIGLAGARALDLQVPRRNKRLLVIVETDGCFVDGVEVATGATVGHRTLRVVDYGKVAATFIHVKTETAVRVAPQLDVRAKAYAYAPDERRRYFAQLHGYQVMPDEALLDIRPVRLARPIGDIISRAGVRVNCDACGEEIINEREVVRAGSLLCRGCAEPAYYQSLEEETAASANLLIPSPQIGYN